MTKRHRRPDDPADPVAVMAAFAGLVTMASRRALLLQSLAWVAGVTGRVRIPPLAVAERFWQEYPPMPPAAAFADHDDTPERAVQALTDSGELRVFVDDGRQVGYAVPHVADFAEAIWASLGQSNN
jgi:hypothetical protein